MLHLVAISRHQVVRYPYDTTFLEARFVKRQMIILVVISLILTSTALLCYKFTSLTGLIPSKFCLLIGNLDRSIIPMAVSILPLVTQIISLCLIPGIYFKISRELKKHQTDTRGMKSSKGYWL